MKIASIVGVRPNFNKEMLINKYLKEKGIDEILIHAGQHYDYKMSKIFFRDCELPEPDYRLDVPTGSYGKQTAEILSKTEEILVKEKPDATLVYGDVNTTLAGAIASTKLKIPVVHIEAGIRTNARYNPEEINRRLSDHASDLLFAPTKDSYDKLIKENFSRNDVYLPGDIVKDNLMHTIKKYGIKINVNNYYVLSLHREENVSSEKRMKNIFDGLIESKKRIIFPVHPRTKQKLEEYGIYGKIKNRNIEITDP